MSLGGKTKLSPVAVHLSRQLRRKSTKAEEIFWEQVRNRRFLGLKFRRQHPLLVDDNGRETFYIADFFCHEKQLVVEIDGDIHLRQKERDAVREKLLREYNLDIKRFRNAEIEEGIEQVMKELEIFIGSFKEPSPCVPLPSGEGF
jgi:very-short-patch-repair endonuclease